jgi:hypothetical protein
MEEMRVEHVSVDVVKVVWLWTTMLLYTPITDRFDRP